MPEGLRLEARQAQSNFQRMVTEVGEDGCGWEASLKSWYRFLIDPVPYGELVRVMCRNSTSQALNCVQPATDSDNRILLDDTLLARRTAFLRDGSLVAIVMLTDENDCSTQVACPGRRSPRMWTATGARSSPASCASRRTMS
jgi:hypothetical protein